MTDKDDVVLICDSFRCHKCPTYETDCIDCGCYKCGGMTSCSTHCICFDKTPTPSFKSKKFLCMSEYRIPECIRECGDILPCVNGCVNIGLDCICECLIHSNTETINMKYIMEMTGGDVYTARLFHETSTKE